MGSVNASIAVLIQKEQINNLKFPSDEVLKSKDEIKVRNNQLERALKLGNLEHTKMKIIFKDSENIKKVETTVWALTDQRVILKNGIMIPIHRIYEVV